MTNLDTQVGKAIHLHMWDLHITQTSLAPKLGMTQSGLSKKLRGDRPWTLDELYRAAAALDCNVVDLLPSGSPIGEYETRRYGLRHRERKRPPRRGGLNHDSHYAPRDRGTCRGGISGSTSRH